MLGASKNETENECYFPLRQHKTRVDYLGVYLGVFCFGCLVKNINPLFARGCVNGGGGGS
jgi:predicted metal-binding membrane protein